MFLTLLSLIPGIIGSIIVTKEIREINIKLGRLNPLAPKKESFIDYMKKQWLWYVLLFTPFGINLGIFLVELYIFDKTNRSLKRKLKSSYISFRKSLKTNELPKSEPIQKAKAFEPVNLNNMDIGIERDPNVKSYGKHANK